MLAITDTHQLFLRAKQGDKAAFERLYADYVTPVYRSIYAKVRHRDTADDLTQVVFLKAFETLGRHTSGNTNPLTYFLSIARTTVIDHWRKKKITAVDLTEEPELASSRPDPRETLEEQETHAALHLALTTLNDEQQEVIIQKFINELSTAEIAALLDKSEDAIRQIQSRAIRQLRTGPLATTL